MREPGERTTAGLRIAASRERAVTEQIELSTYKVTRQRHRAIVACVELLQLEIGRR